MTWRKSKKLNRDWPFKVFAEIEELSPKPGHRIIYNFLKSIIFHANIIPFNLLHLPYALYCLCLYTLQASFCVNTSGLCIYTAFFFKNACNTSVLSFVIAMFLFWEPIFLPWYFCPRFSVLSSLWCYKSSNILRTKKMDFL